MTFPVSKLEKGNAVQLLLYRAYSAMKKLLFSLFFPAVNLLVFGTLSVLFLLSQYAVSPSILAVVISGICGGVIPACIIIKHKIDVSEFFFDHLKVLGIYVLIALISALIAFVSLILYLIVLAGLLIGTIIIYWHMSEERIKRIILIMSDPVLYISVIIVTAITEFAVYGLKF